MAARRNHWGVEKVFADMASQRLFDRHQACQRCSQPVCWVGYVVGIVLCDGTRVPGIHPMSLTLRRSLGRFLVSIGVVVSVVPTDETNRDSRERWVTFWRSRKECQGRAATGSAFGEARPAVKARKEQPPPLQGRVQQKPGAGALPVYAYLQFMAFHAKFICAEQHTNV